MQPQPSGLVSDRFWSALHDVLNIGYDWVAGDSNKGVNKLRGLATLSQQAEQGVDALAGCLAGMLGISGQRGQISGVAPKCMKLLSRLSLQAERRGTALEAVKCFIEGGYMNKWRGNSGKSSKPPKQMLETGEDWA